jgi:amino acid transporter
MQAQPSHKIGVATATIVGMNAMIGAGVFTAPASLAAYVGPAVILVYIAVIFSVWCMALALARLAYLYPETGSFYTYAKQWGGHWVGLMTGICYLLGPIIAMGLLSQTAGTYLTRFFPCSSMTLGFCVLMGLIVLNMCGVILSEIGQIILIICTLFPLLAITLLCFMHSDLHNLIPFAPYGYGNIFKATRIVIFGFFGFECATSLFAIVDNPQRNVPRALTYSIALVGLIYTLFITSLILSVPLASFQDPLVPLSVILDGQFPGNYWLIMLIHCSILSAMIGTIHSMVWSAGELALSLGSRACTRINTFAQQHTLLAQRIAVVCIGLGISVTFFSITNLDLFWSLTALCIITAYIVSFITLLTIRSEWYNGHNGITLIGCGTAGTIMYFALQGLIEALYIS